MDKDEFKKRLIESQIYDELKDSTMTGANYIKNKWQGLDIDYSRVYRKIVNYQVKKYGNSLTTPNKKVVGRSKEELNKIAERRKYRKKHYGIKGEK